MSRAIKIILSFLLSLLIAGVLVVGYLYFIAGSSIPNTLTDWFPGNSEDGGVIITTPDPNQIEEEAPLPQNALMQISRNSVGGAGFRDSAGTTTVVYVERETGNFFSYYPESNEKIRLSNATLPRIQEAIFSTDGSRALLRYLNENSIETFMADIPETADLELGELRGTFLARNINTATRSGLGENFLYMTEGEGGGIRAFITAQALTQVWTSPIKEWIPTWVNGGTFSLQTKASGAAVGYSYLFNKDTKVMQTLVGNIPGLTVLVRPDLKASLYSESGEGWVTLSAINVESGVRTELLLTRTLPEKCVWKNVKSTEIICAVPNEIVPGLYPDLWYQGEVSFSDSLWLIDTETGAISLLADLKKETDSDIDATHLSLGQNDGLLIFQNKRDGSLWKLTLPNTIQQ